MLILEFFFGFLVFNIGEIKFFEDKVLLIVLDLILLIDFKSGEIESIVLKVLFFNDDNFSFNKLSFFVII